MKKLLPILLIMPLFALAQSDCENHAAVGVSYILPKGFSVEGAYFAQNRLTAGIGVAYSLGSASAVVKTDEQNQASGNSLDLFAYAGYKVIQVDYVVSAFLNAGYTMGDVRGLAPFVSSKILFPAGRKAFSVEPFYVFNRGLTARATVYIKL